MNIVASETDAQGNYISPNGSYDTATDTFTFDITAGLKNVKDVSFTAMVKTAGHELTHFIQKWSPSKYLKLKNETLRFLEHKHGRKWIAERTERIIDNNREVGTTLTIEEARDELVADSFENVLTEIDFAERILKADKTLFDKIHSWVKQHLAKFKKSLAEAVKGLGAQTEAGKTMQEAGEDARALYELWGDAFTIAFENSTARAEAQAVGEGVRYQFREYSDKQKENWKSSKNIVIYENDAQFRRFIRDARSDSQLQQKLYFGVISDELARNIKEKTGIDIEGYNCALSANEIRKIFKDHGDPQRESLRGQRAFDEEDFLNIPRVIEEPKTIQKSGKEYDGKPAIVFTSEFADKMTVVAVVSDKRLDLRVQTAYINKKRNLAVPIDEQASINTPKASHGTVSNSSISLSDENVNKKTKVTVKNQARYCGRKNI